jgi:hypothetical protein
MEICLDDRKAAPAAIDALVGINRDLDDGGVDAKPGAWNRIGVGFRPAVRRR